MKFSRLSKYKIRKILEVFCKDLNASVAAQILGINRNTVNRYYNLFREAVFRETLLLLEKELGVFEADESYFGARRVRGRRGRGAAGKTPVFGLLRRNGKVLVSLVKNCSTFSKIVNNKTTHNIALPMFESTNLSGPIDIIKIAMLIIKKNTDTIKLLKFL